MILAAQGDTSGAVAHYREAVRVEPELAAAHNNLAITLEDMGQMDEATRRVRRRRAAGAAERRITL